MLLRDFDPRIWALALLGLLLVSGCLRRDEPSSKSIPPLTEPPRETGLPGNNTEPSLGAEERPSGVPLVREQHLNPQALAWDGKSFWTAHEPGWEMEDDVKPGHASYQAYLVKHADDENMTAVAAYAFPHHYNVIGMAWVGGQVWTSSWINRSLGRIYRFQIDNGSLVENGAWDTKLSCDGLAWDGTHLWCNMGGSEGIWKFDVSRGLRPAKVYPVVRGILFMREGGTHPKGIAWDGRNIWTAYKYSDPAIVKHNMDENLSVVAGFRYRHPLLSEFPGDIAFADGALYSSSSDLGTGGFRGGRIARHRPEDLSVDSIHFYNDYHVEERDGSE